jgi:hypothetical protein
MPARAIRGLAQLRLHVIEIDWLRPKPDHRRIADDSGSPPRQNLRDASQLIGIGN